MKRFCATAPVVNPYACPALPRDKPPKDGAGPRGLPDVYHIPCVLNSTFRYVKFVKRLRTREEEYRKGSENNLKNIKEQQILDFFTSCDRRSLINTVARRVDLGMQAFERDMDVKRKKLTELYQKEEERDIRMFVEQVQAMREIEWKEKLARLEFLLAKRKKENEDIYKDIPLAKVVHAYACLMRPRAKEVEAIQLYQMKEKEAIKMAERERDKMWHEMVMKETEALTARMELDAIDEYRRIHDCNKRNEAAVQVKRQQREVDRRRQETEGREWQEKCKEDLKLDDVERQAVRDLNKQIAAERATDLAERQVRLEKEEADNQMVEDAWENLARVCRSGEGQALALRRKKERETDICNVHLIKQRDSMGSDPRTDQLIERDLRMKQEALDRKRCDYLLWSQKTNRDVRTAMIDQIKDRKDAAEKLKQRLYEEQAYHDDLFRQSSELIKFKDMDDARIRKQHQLDLIEQINYNKLLKERALQEEMDQRRKAKEASKAYQEEVNRMVCNPPGSEHTHAFMQQLKGIKMKPTCLCSKRTYCGKKSDDVC